MSDKLILIPGTDQYVNPNRVSHAQRSYTGISEDGTRVWVTGAGRSGTKRIETPAPIDDVLAALNGEYTPLTKLQAQVAQYDQQFSFEDAEPPTGDDYNTIVEMILGKPTHEDGWATTYAPGEEDDEDYDAQERDRADGASWRHLCGTLGVCYATHHRYIAEMIDPDKLAKHRAALNAAGG